MNMFFSSGNQVLLYVVSPKGLIFVTAGERQRCLRQCKALNYCLKGRTFCSCLAFRFRRQRLRSPAVMQIWLFKPIQSFKKYSSLISIPLSISSCLYSSSKLTVL